MIQTETNFPAKEERPGSSVNCSGARPIPLVGDRHLLLIAEGLSIILHEARIEILVVVLICLKLDSNEILDFAGPVEDPRAAPQSRHVELIVKLEGERK